MPLSTTRTKFRYTVEYPVNASPKILYPYISSATGLSQWFCQRVRMDEQHRFIFTWDNQDHYAEMNSHRTNRSARFVFLDKNLRQVPDANFLDFTLESSELTQEVFLRIVDYSEETDTVELREMWDGLIQNLREQVGG